MNVDLRALIAKLNDTTRSALETAAGLCVSRTHYDVEIEHLLIKLVETPDGDMACILRHFRVDPSRVIAELTRSLDQLKTGNARTPSFSPLLVRALTNAWVVGSIDYSAAVVRSAFVAVALLSDDELSERIRDVSATLDTIKPGPLRQDLLKIVDGSVEKDLSVRPDEVLATSGGTRVFISYRKDDTNTFADSLFDRLLASVEGVRVFRDKDTLKPGMIFSEKIDETIEACDVVLALIGKKWLKVLDGEGRRRIDDEHDWVRLEIAAALRHNKYVIPCLVGGAKMPTAAELPPDLVPLSLRQGVAISQANLRRDSEELIKLLQQFKR